MAHIKRYAETTFVLFMTLCALHGIAFANPIEAVRARVYAWADAWQSRDIISYMSFYSPTFHAEKMDHKQWLNKKAKHFQSSSSIEVSISDLWVLIEDNRATASFVQRYRDDRSADIGEKTLHLVNENDEWMIISEAWMPLQGAYAAAVKDAIVDRQSSDAEYLKKETAGQKSKNNGQPFGDEVMVKNIQFHVADHTEKVCLNFNTYTIPVVFTLANNNPRVVIDLNNVYHWKGEYITPVAGKIIKQIRTYLHRKIHKLRIVLDLNPAEDYVIDQTYDPAAYRYCIGIK